MRTATVKSYVLSNKPDNEPLEYSPPSDLISIAAWKSSEISKSSEEIRGGLPREGSQVCAKGEIQVYRGVPEIVVRSSGQLSN